MPLRRLAIVLLLSLLPALARAEAPPPALDWGVWQAMPVFHKGRMTPVNTFARTAVKKISGRESPQLTPPEDTATDATQALFPQGKPRRFEATELLFSWLVEPQRWEEVPFVVAGHEGLRREVFDLPALDRQGNHLNFVSPAQIRRALPAIRMRLADAEMKQRQAQAHGQKYAPTDLESRLTELLDSYTLYRSITFQPGSVDEGPTRYTQRLNSLVDTWNRVSEDLHSLGEHGAGSESVALVTSAEESLQKLIELARKDAFSLAETEPVVVKLREATSALAEQFGSYSRRLFEEPPQDWGAEQLKRARASVQAVASAMADLARESNEAHIALYDGGHTLRLVPALDPAALEQKRDEQEDAQPWLSVTALLQGSDALVAGYPKEAVARVRTAFAAVSAAYLDRANAQRPAKFQEAMQQFAGAVRTLGEQLEPLRRQLPIHERDEALLAVTAYPGPEATWAEVHYAQFAPFLWSWVVSALALGCFGLAFSILRKPMFWLGMAVLLASQCLSIYGFALRVYITGWAPVTNMFETVMFVALVVSILGAAFVFGPLLLPGLRHAWRMTAAPFTWEAGPLGEAEQCLLSPAAWRGLGAALLVPRLVMTYGVVKLLTQTPYGAGNGYTIVSLWPRAATGNDLVVWLVGMLLLVTAAWYVPRAILAGIAGVLLVPYTLFREGLQEPLQQALARKPFAMAGASVGLLTALIAYFAPIFDENINPLMPVLRDNFWLTLHVLTITASYGAGALAWGLGNLSLRVYAFGRYRDPAETVDGGHQPAGGGEAPRLGRRPPEVCATLGGFIYKSMQVAVLLLAAGTILGGLWADVSWGRFWGWDSKEVWALISLLIYLAVLHGRYAGWFGNFGLAVGSVVGVTAIVMAWYGVNFWLGSGLHSYGEGAGGGGYVLAGVAVNWLFVALAAMRYYLETNQPTTITADLPSEKLGG